MIVLITYDITDNRRRTRVAEQLQAVGERIQRSVFLVHISPQGLADLRGRLRGLLDLDEDSLYFFRQCSACWAEIDRLGQAELPAQPLYWAVL